MSGDGRGLLALDRDVPYRELRDPPLPDELRTLALACFAAQRRAGSGRLATKGDAPTHDGDRPAATRRDPEAVSAEALARLLAEGRSIGGVVTEREIATAIPFNARFTRDVVWSGEVAALRARLDREVAHWLAERFAETAGPPLLSAAGQWWYPPGTHFGWHTNHGYPGWRLYLSHAEEPDRSFFRYRDPRSGGLVTSLDGRWHVRVFEVASDRPLWHAIHSDTHRFSIGWFVRPWTLRGKLAAVVKQWTDAAATMRRTQGAAGLARAGGMDR